REEQIRRVTGHRGARAASGREGGCAEHTDRGQWIQLSGTDRPGNRPARDPPGRTDLHGVAVKVRDTIGGKPHRNSLQAAINVNLHALVHDHPGIWSNSPDRQRTDWGPPASYARSATSLSLNPSMIG